MIGSRFCELSKLQLLKADLKGENSIDITNRDSTFEFFQNNNFQSVLLLSAFTDVDEAEKQKGNKNGVCWQVNVLGVKNVVAACNRFKTKLIFISTDFVFDGSNGPYKEEDEVGPDLSKVSWYGITKIEAEKNITSFLDEFIIIRISYPYRARFEKKDDFAKQILRRHHEQTLYKLFTDQQMTPTFIDDLVPCIDLLLQKNVKGIYHLASPIPTTPYDFGFELLKVFKRDPSLVEKGSLKTSLKKAGITPRPLKGGMKTQKIEDLGFIPTEWQLGIRSIFKQSKGQLI